MPYFAAGYSSVTAAASRCAVEWRIFSSGSSVDSCSPYSAIGVVQYMDGNLLTWPDIVDAIGYPATGLGILVESIGVPLPGEALLFLAAGWAGSQHHSLVLVVLLTFIASTIGADTGYVLGFKGGRPFVERFGTVFHIRPDHIARSELFFARHGDGAILAGRFVLG